MFYDLLANGATLSYLRTPLGTSGKVDMAFFSLLVLKSTLLLKKVKKSTA